MNSTEALERTRAVIRRQHKTMATEQIYLHWLRHYMVALREMPKTLASEQKLEHFLTDLALKKNVSASTQNQAFNAILFSTGHPAQRGGRLARHATGACPPRADGGGNARFDRRRAIGPRLSHQPGGPPPCGLRVSEPLNLRVKDVSFADGRLFIIGGKGRKDRVVALPCSVTV